jgi:hypothetical protein
MNTAQEKLPSDLDALLAAEGAAPNPKDETIASLNNQVQELQDGLLEERFRWILACVVLLDIYVFSHMENWAGALVIGVLELIGVVITADRCGVNTVAPFIDKLTGFAHRAAKTTAEKNDEKSA